MAPKLYTQPLVSIAMPVFNGSKLIYRALESCINQTYGNIEIVIVDNISVDNTEAVIAEYIRKDRRIKYFKNKEALSVDMNFFQAVAYSSGEFVQLLAHDDWLSRNYIKKCVEIYDIFPEAGFVSSKILNFSNNNKDGTLRYCGDNKSRAGKYLSDRVLRNKERFGNFYVFCRRQNFLNTKSLMSEKLFYDEKYSDLYKKGLCGDCVISLQLMAQCEYFVHTNEIVYIKMVTMGSAGNIWRHNDLEQLIKNYDAFFRVGMYVCQGIYVKYLTYWKRFVAPLLLSEVFIYIVNGKFTNLHTKNLKQIKNFFLENGYTRKEIIFSAIQSISFIIKRFFGFSLRKLQIGKKEEIISDREIFLKDGKFKI